MRFYVLSYHSHGPSNWTWAWKVRPHPSANGALCDLCGKGMFYPESYPEYPIMAEVDGGRGYPDVLGCSHSLLVVSESVLEDWKSANVSGIQAFPFTIAKAQGKRISISSAPQYYHIQVTGRCELDLEAMGIRITFLCPQRGYYEEEKLPVNAMDENAMEEEEDPFGIPNFVIKEDTWDGSDLFVSSLFYRIVFCSQRIFDLARLHKRTNFSFRLPEHYAAGSLHNIPYL